MLLGGPHNNNIAGVTVTLKQAQTPEFKEYAAQVIKNAQTLAKALQEKGVCLSPCTQYFVCRTKASTMLMLGKLGNKAICADYLGYKIVTDGTDTHMFLLDIRGFGIDGAKVDTVMEMVSISGMY